MPSSPMPRDLRSQIPSFVHVPLQFTGVRVQIGILSLWRGWRPTRRRNIVERTNYRLLRRQRVRTQQVQHHVMGGKYCSELGKQRHTGHGLSSQKKFDELDKDVSSAKPSKDILKLMKAIRGSRHWSMALSLFRRAKGDGLIPDNMLYSLVIGILAKAGRWSTAVQLLREARLDGLEPSTFCYAAAVNACAKGRNWKLALSLIAEMRREGLDLDLVTYGSAVSAMAKVGHWRLALAFLSRMRSEGLRPNVVCYGAAIDACAKGGEWKRALALLDDMQTDGVMPDKICFNSAVHACAQSGQWQLALGIVERMRRTSCKRLKPDSFTWNSVIHAMAKGGEWERVLRTVKDMENDGVKPDNVSFNTAMRACNQAGRYERCLLVLEDMEVAGLEPDQETLAAVTEAYAEDKTMAGDEAASAVVRLLEHARSKGWRPEARAIAASLAACVGGGPWREAVPAIGRMVKTGDGWEEVMAFLKIARVEGLRRRSLMGPSGPREGRSPKAVANDADPKEYKPESPEECNEDEDEDEDEDGDGDGDGDRDRGRQRGRRRGGGSEEVDSARGTIYALPRIRPDLRECSARPASVEDCCGGVFVADAVCPGDGRVPRLGPRETDEVGTGDPGDMRLGAVNFDQEGEQPASAWSARGGPRKSLVERGIAPQAARAEGAFRVDLETALAHAVLLVSSASFSMI